MTGRGGYYDNLRGRLSHFPKSPLFYYNIPFNKIPLSNAPSYTQENPLSTADLSRYFLWFHDWIPIGRLNDIQAVKKQGSQKCLVATTLIQSVPYTLGLFFSFCCYNHLRSSWVYRYLLTAYILLFIGELRTWWVPYFWIEEPNWAERYRVLFGNTHSFFPERKGVGSLRPSIMPPINSLRNAAARTVL